MEFSLWLENREEDALWREWRSTREPTALTLLADWYEERGDMMADMLRSFVKSSYDFHQYKSNDRGSGMGLVPPVQTKKEENISFPKLAEHLLKYVNERGLRNKPLFPRIDMAGYLSFTGVLSYDDFRRTLDVRQNDPWPGPFRRNDIPPNENHSCFIKSNLFHFTNDLTTALMEVIEKTNGHPINWSDDRQGIEKWN